MNRNAPRGLVPWLFIALVLVSVLGARYSLERLSGHMALLRDDGLETIRKEFGETLDWESISPTIIRGISINGVTIGEIGRAERVQVLFRPIDILLGRVGDAIPEIVIVRPRVYLETTESLESVEHIIRTAAERAQGRLRTTVRVRNGTIRYRDETQTATVQQMYVQVVLDQTMVTAGGRMETRYARTDDDDPFSLATDLTLELQGPRRDQDFQGTVDIGTISGTHLTAEGQSFYARYRNGTIRVERIRSNDPLDLAATFDVETGRTTVDARSSLFRLADVVQLHGPWSGFQRFLTIPITSVGSAVVGNTGVVERAEGAISTRVALEELPEPVSIDANLTYEDGTLLVPDMTIRPASGAARVSGRWDVHERSASGAIVLDALSYAESPRVSGNVVFTALKNDLRVSASTMSLGETVLYSLSFEGRRSGSFIDGSFSASGSEDTVDEVYGRFRMAGFDDISGEVNLVGFSLGTIAQVGDSFGRALDLPSSVLGLEVSGTGRFDRRQGSFSVDIPNLVLADPDSELIVRVGGRYSDGKVLVERYYLRNSGVIVYGEALVTFGSAGTIDFDTDFVVNQIEYSFRGIVDPQGNLLVLGPYGVEARLRRTRAGALRLVASVESLPLPIGRSTLSTQFDGLFLDRSTWYVGFNEIRLNDLPIPGGRTASLVLAATIQPNTISVALLQAQDLVGTVTGTADVEYSIGETLEATLEGRFGALDGPEQYRISARYQAGRFGVDARILSSPVNRLSPRIRDGTVSGTVQAAGTVDDPQIRAFFESSDIRSGDREIEFSLFLYGDNRELRIAGSELRLETTEVSIDTIRLDRNEGTIEGTLEYRDRSRNRSDRVHILGDTDRISDLSSSTLVSLPVRAQIETVPLDQERPTRVYLIERSSGVTSLRRDDDAIAGRIDDSGTFDLRTQAPFPISMRAEGYFGRGSVELTASGVRIDLQESIDFLAIPGLEDVQGTAEGAIRVIGRPDDPDMYGTLRIRNFATTTSFSPEPIGPLDTAVIVEEKLIRLRPTVIDVDGTSLEINGNVLLNRFVPSVYEFSLAIAGDTGLRIVQQFGPVDVDGYGLGRIDVRGNRNRISIAGSIRANGTRITLSDEYVRRERDTDILVDLDLETGRAVQFIWPDRDFPILRANFANNQQISISSNSLTREFELLGEAEIQSGDVFYFDRSFFLREGTVVFRENQDQFDPRLTVRAELREATPEGTVRIYLVAENQALSEFSPRFESNPPLTGNEIIAILGGNIFQQSGEAVVNLSTALLSTSDIVTQFGLFRSFEDAVREQFNLDLFAIRTSLIQNALLTAIDPTDETVQQVSPSLGTYLNNTSIFMGRYLGDAVFGQILVELRSRDFLDEDEEDQGIRRLGGVLIDSEISLEWQTPFFLLEWAIAPQNPEELFVRDNTFSFLWSFRY